MLQNYLGLNTGEVWYMACIIGALVWGLTIGIFYHSNKKSRESTESLVWLGLLAGIVSGAATLLITFHTKFSGGLLLLVSIVLLFAVGIPVMQKRKERKRDRLPK